MTSNIMIIHVVIPLIITCTGPHYEAPPPSFTVATQIPVMHDRHVTTITC